MEQKPTKVLTHGEHESQIIKYRFRSIALGPEDGPKTLVPPGGIYGVDKKTGAICRLVPKVRHHAQKKA